MLHVAFGQSAGGSLIQAIRKLGRNDRMICDADDLGYGPIDPPSAELRVAFIDELVTREWQPCGRVVVDAFYENRDGDFLQTGDTVLWSRLRALVEDGTLEGRRDGITMRESWVRLPGSIPA